MRGPSWLSETAGLRLPPGDDEAAMAHAVALARRNVASGGGPFGAVVVRGDGAVAGQGVNSVVATGTSLAHAELLAVLDAQRSEGRARLHEEDRSGPWTLVTTAQPCVMCHGAVFWAGLDALVVGARTSDVEELAGFDEGPVPPAWEADLASRGIAVRRDVLREACRGVLAAYAGPLY
jgi:tRNA(Arg) A34 adenosine deaminase TadA